MFKLVCVTGTARCRLCVTVRCPSVCPSVCLFQHGPTAAGLLTVGVCSCGPGGREILMDCCECGQCHVVSVRRQLNTDLFALSLSYRWVRWRYVWGLSVPLCVRECWFAVDFWFHMRLHRFVYHKMQPFVIYVVRSVCLSVCWLHNLQKSLKRWYLSASRWHSGDVMVGNITFVMIHAAFDPSPLRRWINCSF